MEMIDGAGKLEKIDNSNAVYLHVFFKRKGLRFRWHLTC